MIILVERGHQIRLARGANFPPGTFSAVAGFVEIGESLEDKYRPALDRRFFDALSCGSPAAPILQLVSASQQ